MIESDFERYNDLLLARLPFLEQQWRETDIDLDHRETGPIVYYNDVLMETLPPLVERARAGDDHAREDIAMILSLAEELASNHDRDGVSLVEGGMMSSLLEAAARYWDVVEMMGNNTRRLFDLAWGYHRFN